MAAGSRAIGAARDKVFYTTGRLTSEMVIKSAQMGVPIVVSRSGITQMGHEIAQRLGLCAIGRATDRHFLCYSAPQRLRLQPELAARQRCSLIASARAASVLGVQGRALSAKVAPMTRFSGTWAGAPCGATCARANCAC